MLVDVVRGQMRYRSGIPLFRKVITERLPLHEIAIAFPDDGAKKRFGEAFKGIHTIVCAKKVCVCMCVFVRACVCVCVRASLKRMHCVMCVCVRVLRVPCACT